MKQYVLAPVIQTVDHHGETTYQAKVQGLAGLTNVVAVIPSKPDGTPLFGWALCYVAGTDFTALTADNSIKLLPQITLDSSLKTLTNQQYNALISVLQGQGIATSTLTHTTSTFRDVVRLAGQTLDPAFSENSFECGGS